MEQSERQSSVYIPPPVYYIYLLGEKSVGKTSVADRLLKDSFSQQYHQSSEVDINRFSDHSNQVQITLFDAPGHPSYIEKAEEYLNMANLVVLVYECGSERSIKKLTDTWLPKIIKGVKKTSKDQRFRCQDVVLCGNKADLEKDSRSYQRIQEKVTDLKFSARKCRLRFAEFQISCKSSTGFNEFQLFLEQKSNQDKWDIRDSLITIPHDFRYSIPQDSKVHDKPRRFSTGCRPEETNTRDRSQSQTTPTKIFLSCLELQNNEETSGQKGDLTRCHIASVVEPSHQAKVLDSNQLSNNQSNPEQEVKNSSHDKEKPSQPHHESASKITTTLGPRKTKPKQIKSETEPTCGQCNLI